MGRDHALQPSYRHSGQIRREVRARVASKIAHCEFAPEFTTENLRPDLGQLCVPLAQRVLCLKILDDSVDPSCLNVQNLAANLALNINYVEQLTSRSVRKVD